MSMPWKNAATLMVAARNRLISSNKPHQSLFPRYRYDYDFMMLKRNSKSNFFAKAFVFPGGATDSADFSPLWLEHFALNGFSHNKLNVQFVNDKRPPIYEELSRDFLPEIGYRITAIRETFEETGVLICKALDGGTQGSSADHIDIEEWQKRVYGDPGQFLELCRRYSLCPDVWSLYEWCNWLTPDGMGPKRFDTIFYLCLLDHVPTVHIDGQEITQVRWMDPVESIMEQVKGDIWLPPPQFYELSRMAHFVDYDHLREFAAGRQQRGVERWLPIFLPTRSGRMTVYPGDDLYSSEGVEKLDGEAISFENSGVNHNRMEFSDPTRCRMSCNITDPFGHQQPVNLIDAIVSKL